MTHKSLFFLIFLVAFLSYLLRVLPFTLFRKPIKNPRIVSFIKYLPYSILTAMVLPSVFTATGSDPKGILSSSIGFIVALIAGFFGLSLPIVALAATSAAFLCHWLF